MQTAFRPEIRAGELRRRITIQQLVEKDDGEGGVVATWPAFRICWAAVEPLSGGERLEYAQLYPSLSVRVTVRYSKGLSPRMRVLYGTRSFEVLDVIDLQEKHEEVALMCRELGTA